jgi:alpha-tubulin suppressor-like RCC1 family protein
VNIAAIACGAFHNMALGADGRLLTWGTNDYGQLGNGSTIYSTTPVEVRRGVSLRLQQRRTTH